MKIRSWSCRVCAKIILILACIFLKMSLVANAESAVHSADNTLYFNSGEKITYGTFFTRRMTFDGTNTAYCMEPDKYPPQVGYHSYQLLDETSDIRKALYYLNGGYGYEEVTKEKYFDGWSDTDSYIVGHLTLSYIYDGYSGSGDAFRGAPQNYIDKTMEVINGLEKLDAPPKSFRAFIVPGTNLQTIAGSWYEKPYGWVEIRKASANTSITEGNDNYSLKGAKYGIFQGDKKIAEMITDEHGYAKSCDLEKGQYEIKEMQAPKGYAVDKTAYEVEVKADETSLLDVKEVPQNNPIELVLQKTDAETEEGKAQGKASLESAEFTVQFYTGSSEGEPAKNWVFKTDKDGRILFTKEYLVSGDSFYCQADGVTPCLPLGTVTIQETKAPEGYLLNENVFEQKITGMGEEECITVYNPPIVGNQICRGDLEMVKVSDGDLKRLANIPFTITSKTTGESHRIVTDRNGYASTASSWSKHTANTNRGETSADGIWFGGGAPDNGKGALLYDTYVIEEESCEANKGRKLLTFEVTIYKDGVTVPLGTLTNDKIELTLEIGTTAVDGADGDKEILAEKNAVIVDTVKYQNLEVGQEYKLLGTLMVKESGEILKINGKPVISELIFTPEETDGEAEILFSFDASKLGGKELVVFEKLFLMSEEEEVEIAVHENLEDDGQTVRVIKKEVPVVQKETPKTGDNSRAILLLLLMAGSVLLLKYGKRLKKQF